MTLLQSLVPNLGRATRVPATPRPTSSEARVKPYFTITENSEGFEAVVHLPGVAKEGLEITAQEGELTITGRKSWNAPAEWTTLYRETPRANFELTLTHGNEVDVEKISAELKHGVLRLTLPKAEAAKPRKITVN